jgi:hypothetical protein
MYLLLGTEECIYWAMRPGVSRPNIPADSALLSVGITLWSLCGHSAVTPWSLCEESVSLLSPWAPLVGVTHF